MIPMLSHGFTWWGMLLQGVAILHFIRRRPDTYWLYIIIIAGWLGASKVVFDHMAMRGYYVAGYSSREAVKAIKRSGVMMTPVEAASVVNSAIGEAKRALGLPEKTPTILTGISRGASMTLWRKPADVSGRIPRPIAGARSRAPATGSTAGATCSCAISTRR